MDHVDIALVVAVDGSPSATYGEFGLIAGGMAAGLRGPAVAAGVVGHAMPSLKLWSGSGQQDVITPWIRINTAGNLAGFAAGIQVRVSTGAASYM